MTAPATRTFLSLGPTGLSLETECKHGHVGYCGMCDAEQAPKCEAHGRPWYCGECGRADGNPRPRHKRPGQWTDRTRAKLLYRIETSYAGSLEGGRFLDLAWGLSMIDALDEWAAKHGGYEALGIAAEDVIAHETDADPPSSAPAPPQSQPRARFL